MQLTSDQYVARGGVVCPHCHNTNLESEAPIMNEYGMTSDTKCHDCGEKWTDEYTLTGYRE